MQNSSSNKNNEQYPVGWIEASIANSSAGLWLPDTLSKGVTPTRRELRRQRHMVEEISRNFGKYYTTNTNTTGNPGNGLPKPLSAISFAALRGMSYSSEIDKLIINALKSAARRYGQICDVPGKQKGFRVVHRQYRDSDFDADTPDIRKRCAEMEELLKHPTSPPHVTFMDFLMSSIEEQLVLDRRCLVLPKDRAGRIGSFHLVDGASVQPVIEVLGPWMRENQVMNEDTARFRMQMDLWKNPPHDQRTGAPVNVDLSEAAYVQVVEGRVVSAWKADEMYIGIANPTVAMDHAFYGRSPLESSIYLSIIFGKIMRFNTNMFDVSFPEGILALTGDVDQEGLDAFKRAALDFDPSESSNRLPIITGDGEIKASLIQLRESPQDMRMVEMTRMIANWKCAAYRVHPSVINVTDEGQPLIGNSDDGAIEQSIGDGFHGLMIDQANLLTNAIVSKRYDDLIVVVEGLDDESEQQALERLQVEKSFKTLNEVRVSRGLKELPEKLPKNLGDFVADSGYLQIYQLLQQQEQQAKQQDMGAYEQGDFGQGADNQGQPWEPGQPTSDSQQQGAPGTEPNQTPPGSPPGSNADAQGQDEAQESGRQAGNPAAPGAQQNPFQKSQQDTDEAAVTIRISGTSHAMDELLRSVNQDNIGRDDDDERVF